MAVIQAINGALPIKDTFNIITENDQALNAEIAQNYQILDDKTDTIFEELNADIVADALALQNHINDVLAAHAAGAISFSSTDPNLTAIEVKTALEQLSTRISNIITSSGTSSTEVVDARLSSVYGAFATLATRLNASDVILNNIIVPTRSATQQTYAQVNSLPTSTKNGLVKGLVKGVSLYNNSKLVVDSLYTPTGVGTRIRLNNLNVPILVNAHQPSFQNIKVTTGEKWFLYAKSDLSTLNGTIGMQYSNNTESVAASQTPTNARNEVYGIVTANLTLSANPFVYDNTNGQVTPTKIQNFASINMTALGYDALTAEQMADLCRNGYFEGLAGSEVDLEVTATNKSSKLQLPNILHVLPNGVADQYNLETGQLTKNINSGNDELGYTLNSGNIEGLSNFSNTQAVYTNIIPSMINVGNGFNRDYIIPNYPTVNVLGGQPESIPYTSFHLAQRLYIQFPIGTFIDIASARLALEGTKILYRLATPVVTQLDKDLLSFENGTLYNKGFLPCNISYTTPTNTASIIQDQSVINEHLERRTNRTDGLWASYIPTLTWTTATPTAPTTIARYTTVGNTCHFNINISSTDGNGATALKITLPIAPTDNNAIINTNAQQKVNTTWSNPLAYIDDDDTNGIQFRSLSIATDAVALEINITGNYEVTV